MEIIRCIVLEDEEPAQKLMRRYLNKMPEMELLEVFDNALEAADFLKENTVDLIFTDIDMPRLTGLGFLRMNSSLPPVIIITAYPNYAVEALDLDVIDYMVKSVPFERFQQAINKAKRYLAVKQTEGTPEQTLIYVKESGRMLKLQLSNIIYVEALADYVKIFTDERMITTLSTLTNIEKILPPTYFMRVHKSFIINTNKIKAIDSANSLVILSNKAKINLGRTYKTNFLASIKPIN